VGYRHNGTKESGFRQNLLGKKKKKNLRMLTMEVPLKLRVVSVCFVVPICLILSN
jgi:hypothetical protein